MIAYYGAIWISLGLILAWGCARVSEPTVEQAFTDLVGSSRGAWTEVEAKSDTKLQQCVAVLFAVKTVAESISLVPSTATTAKTFTLTVTRNVATETLS